MKSYDPKKIESKWQKEWEKKKIYSASDKPKKKKFYALIEFPYPSGDGLHVGHPRPYIAMDVVSRKRRMEGYNVLFPIGWDAFGLPTENFAIKTGIQPAIVTKKNTDNFRKQVKMFGPSFDWSREINTTDPEYYKWTQWIFLQFFKKGLAYKSKAEINWCPKDKIGLANEEVVDGKCERCGTVVEKRNKEQWMLAITKYADRLDKDLDLVDFPERVKLSQRNWIGRSEGAEIEFKLKNSEHKIKVFTTRPDTIFGATYLVLAPEHGLLEVLKEKIQNLGDVEKYLKSIKKKTEIERTAEGKEKTGVELKGIKATNPANQEEISVWIADYVLPQYGTGAIMAVPEHDERDRDFAVKFNLPIVDRPLVDSKEITKKVGGRMVTRFKLRDWIFSRQRYWGEPIPIVNCQKCGLVPLPEKDLPLLLPKVKNYQPTDTGESPLAGISKWVKTKCPTCKGEAERETDTMPNWAGSSWYYLRYTDPKNKKAFADKNKLKYWTPVDWYNGGMEHTTLHLLYSRFWHKFLYDLKLVPTTEPYKKRTSHGMILGEGGVKMSKSIGNVINPDEIIKIYGADTLRIYEMFIGPFEESAAWSTESIVGSRRFVEKVWRIGEKVKISAGTKSKISTPRSPESVEKNLHKTIKKVSEDIESMRFNTAISAMMILANEIEKAGEISAKDFKMFLKILSPFAPHITEELWNILGEKKSIHISDWPTWNDKILVDDEVKIVIQVNGKVRGEIMIGADESEDEIKKKATENEGAKKHIGGSPIRKVIYVPKKLINIVI
ncbi:MAG TPA: class I tRNA ligase family protein [Candidatus Paceibacterota bacterium]|nr:class I tRNA ligase family protein [Candidatus Paceibacterota bacterium]